MEYRMSHSGTIYRTSPQGNQVLTPFGWTLCVFLLGQSGWQLLCAMTQPVALNPAWPA